MCELDAYNRKREVKLSREMKGREEVGRREKREGVGDMRRNVFSIICIKISESEDDRKG